MNARGRISLLTLALLLPQLPAPTRAGAAGNDIRWNDCSTSGAQSLYPTCQGGASDSFILGIVPPPGADHVTGFSAQITFDTGIGIPPFWETWLGGCSSGRLLASFDFTLGPSTCADPWQGHLDGTLEFDPLLPGGPNRIRLNGTLPAGQEVVMSPQVEYYLCRVTVQQTHPACTGCEMPACFVLDHVCLTQGSGEPQLCQGYREVGTPWITWQQSPQQSAGCWLPVPARRSTWGSLKSVYR